MDQYNEAEFAKNSENKEDPSAFTPAVRESGIAQGSIVYSKLYNTMLGEITKFNRSISQELTNVLAEANITPSDASMTQVLSAIKQIVKDNATGIQVGDILPNIGNDAPVGRVVCNGQWLYNCRVLFPDFYKYVTEKTPYVNVATYTSQLNTYGQCGFCAVDGDNVRVPTINRPISGVSNLNQTGQAILDTMRPITGTYATADLSDDVMTPETSGAFYAYRSNYRDAKNGSSQGFAIGLDSGRLGARYSGSETRGKQVQYPYSVQVYTAATPQSLVDVQELINLLKYQNQLGIIRINATSGNVSLASGGIYTMTMSGDTVFSLSTPSDLTTLNQIMLQLSITADSVVNWGTTKYFSDTPSSAEGNYNIIWEFDVAQQAWIVGQVMKV